MTHFKRPLSRRHFIATTSTALGGFALGRPVSAAILKSGADANSLFPEMMPGDDLRALAAVALQAAKGAGASYSDVRLSHRHYFSVSLPDGNVPSVFLTSHFKCGSRAQVDGAFAFEYGDVPTVDAVASTATNAAVQARGFARARLNQVGLAPAPIVRGEWTSPVKIDPFAVPVVEQADLISAFQSIGDRIEGGKVPTSFTWEREVHVCATSDGTLVTQTFTRAYPTLFVNVFQVGLPVPGIASALSGYELVSDPKLQERVKAFGHEVERYALMPVKSVDVGRYPVVCSGTAMSALLIHTLAQALDLDRVLGYEADASGTSFLAPPAEVLGQQFFSPSLSVSAGRPVDTIVGARWDDEGVVPEHVDLIEAGKVIDYISNRRNAGALSEWYTSRHMPVRSHGYAIAADPARTVTTGGVHLAMDPVNSRSALPDLCKDIKQGVLLLHANSISTDQQVASGLIPAGAAFELRDGKITGRAPDIGLQFKTKALWKGLMRIGDASTIGRNFDQIGKGQPWQYNNYSAESPAGVFSSIDAIRMGSR